jgi:hypothetical protein
MPTREICPPNSVIGMGPYPVACCTQRNTGVVGGLLFHAAVRSGMGRFPGRFLTAYGAWEASDPPTVPVVSDRFSGRTGSHLGWLTAYVFLPDFFHQPAF